MLQARWRTPLASERRFTSRTEDAARIAERLSGGTQTQPLTWVHFTLPEWPDEDDRLEPDGEYVDCTTVLAQDTIAHLAGDEEEEDLGPDLPAAIIPFSSPHVPTPIPPNFPGTAFEPVEYPPRADRSTRPHGASTAAHADAVHQSSEPRHRPDPRPSLTKAEMYQRDLMLAEDPNPVSASITMEI